LSIAQASNTNPYSIIASPSDPNSAASDIGLDIAFNYGTLADGGHGRSSGTWCSTHWRAPSPPIRMRSVAATASSIPASSVTTATTSAATAVRPIARRPLP
jgi:hypothetical protein